MKLRLYVKATLGISNISHQSSLCRRGTQAQGEDHAIQRQHLARLSAAPKRSSLNRAGDACGKKLFLLLVLEPNTTPSHTPPPTQKKAQRSSGQPHLRLPGLWLGLKSAASGAAWTFLGSFSPKGRDTWRCRVVTKDPYMVYTMYGMYCMVYVLYSSGISCILLDPE